MVWLLLRAVGPIDRSVERGAGRRAVRMGGMCLIYPLSDRRSAAPADTIQPKPIYNHSRRAAAGGLAASAAAAAGAADGGVGRVVMDCGCKSIDGHAGMTTLGGTALNRTIRPHRGCVGSTHRYRHADWQRAGPLVVIARWGGRLRLWQWNSGTKRRGRTMPGSGVIEVVYV